MRNISFALTTAQVRARTKTVTRRLAWVNVPAGTLLQGIVKGMGLKKGEKIEKLAVIRLVSVRRERLDAIDQADVVREGFPDYSPDDFIKMFCAMHDNCTPGSKVTRLEFEYVDLESGDAVNP